MTRWIPLFAGFVSLTCLTGCQTPISSPDDLTIQVDGGQISGTPVGSDGQVLAYTGIPYAAPPVGDLRWKPPQPVKGWDGVREAHQFSPVCPQPIFSGPSVLETSVATQEQSEDCLYLNVWTGAAGSDERRPVMLWIHGGGLIGGSGSRPREDGAALARKGAVLVTINYRLGPLGYLAHPELTAESEHNSSGNYGLLDQIVALQWVQRNIASFGGDPNRVTIFGVSAGSWSVSYLVATPLAKGLFHQAIGQSGGHAFIPMAHLKEDQLGVGAAEAIGTRFAADLEADEESNALEVMRGKTAQEIIDTFYSSLFRSGRPIILRANVDGWVFSDQVYEIFARGEQNDVPVIVGSTADDGTVLIFQANNVSQQAYQARAREKYQHLTDEFFALYPVGSDEEARAAFLGETRGEGFTWGMRTWARMMKTVSSEAYLYFFFRIQPRPEREILGSYHTGEVAYVFNNLDAMDWTFEDTDVQLSRMMSDYWLNFASTGDPNGEGLPLWAPYRLEEEPYMHFGDTVEPGSDGFLNREVDFFDSYSTWRRSR